MAKKPPARLSARRPTTRPDEPKEKDLVKKGDADILALSKENWQRNSDAESMMRMRMLRDLTISSNISGDELWDRDSIAERAAEKRPRISIDRFAQPIKTLVNQHRQSGSAIQVSPVDQGSDEETAQVFQGIIRNIENQSRAKLAYMWAFEHAVRMGRGFVRIVPEFVGDRSFDQDLKIKRVINPFTVYPDTACIEPDTSDATCYHVIEDLLPAAFKLKYKGKSEFDSLNDYSSVGHKAPTWFPGKHIRVAEFFYADDSVTETIVLIGNGQGQPMANPETGEPLILLERELRDFYATLPPEIRRSATILKKRDVTVRSIKWCKHNGLEVLEKTDVPGKYIPIVPTIGEEIVVDGERDLRGIVRGAIDAVKSYSYHVTAMIEQVGLSPKAPYIIAHGQVKGFEAIWGTANTKNHAWLPYNVVDAGNRLVPPPQRQGFTPAIQGLVAAIMQADNDVKATTMHWDPSLGKEGPEQSGRAILARQQQADVGTSHFSGNFHDITLTHIGRILVEQIPHYYDTARTLRILGEDEKPRTVEVNREFTDPKTQEMRIHDLNVGKYDVVVSEGPGYATKQQQTREQLGALVEAIPQVFTEIADVYFKVNGLPELAKRFKKPDDGEADPAQMQQQLQQAQQQIEEMGAALQEAQQAVQVQQAKADAHLQVETLKIKASAETKAAEIGVKADEMASKERMAIEALESAESIAALKADIEKLKILQDAEQAKSDEMLEKLEMVLKYQQAERSDATKLTGDREKLAASAQSTREQIAASKDSDKLKVGAGIRTEKMRQDSAAALEDKRAKAAKEAAAAKPKPGKEKK